MNPLFIRETSDTPKVILDKQKNIFEISGLSLPEDAIAFCRQIFNWIEEYSTNPNNPTTFNFILEYFNTAFSSQIIQILLLLEKLNTKTKVVINWHYKDIDEDMKELGEKYSDIVNVQFVMMPYS
ncbi:MAG: DUF1987 domain-containing protein [Bacteroidales bacterium]|nr:DUF1987 domain-containing protein [Bacteroidales bacterium]